MVLEALRDLFAQKASCYEGTKGSKSYPKRTNLKALKEIFLKHASVYKNGERYMSADDFVNRVLELSSNENDNEKSIELLAGIVDTSKDGLISFSEFQAFEKLLCVPDDAVYKTAYEMFDTKGKGKVTLSDFAEIINNTELNKKLPFDMNNDLLKLYFRKNKLQEMNYEEFRQFLHVTKNNDDGSNVRFPFFTAFGTLLMKMEIVKQVYLKAANGSQSQELIRDEFQYQVHKMPRITPIEVDIIFKLCKLNNGQGKVTYSDLQSIAPDGTETAPRPVLLSNKKPDEVKYNPFSFWKGDEKSNTEVVNLSDNVDHRSPLMATLESIYRLIMGFMAGATGAAAVYPIDLVKTRMQNQRINAITGERMYNHSFDCFYKVIKYEGVRGLYRGLLPQVCGVAPEKATKLTVNDFIRDKFKAPNGDIPLWSEILAGGCGGFSQVVFSNPVEIIKIQLQVAGEVKDQPRPSALAVFKEKFFFGLYKGASACFCRDITFAGIYFPTYANVKKMLTDDSGYNQAWTLFLSGLIAGVPAASMATPFDVVKTRLQVKPRPGQTTYNGIRDAFRKVWREEGWTAFWKGAGARVCRSSPQFGVTLVTYELLQRFLYIDFGGRRPEGSEHKKNEPKKVSYNPAYNPDHKGGYEAAIPMITGIETQFGISLPKFNIVPITTNAKKPDEP